MHDHFIVRPALREDFDQWQPLWTAYNAFYGRSGDTALHPDISQMTWSRIFDAYEPVRAVVAESDGQLLGFAHYIFHRSTIAIQPTCYLQDLMTLQAARGKGVGRALIGGVAQAARSANAARLYWQTHETNATAMRLYDAIAEKSGFVVYRMAL